MDIRLICATNENLAQAVAEGKFREDLYHRINEFTIYMPALKDRGADIFLFANLFIKHANQELGKMCSEWMPKPPKSLPHTTGRATCAN